MINGGKYGKNIRFDEVKRHNKEKLKVLMISATFIIN